MATTVRKFAVGGRVALKDEQRILAELDTQHRNKNKHIAIERLRRQSIRQAQYDHPVIGELTRMYERVEAERNAVVGEIKDRYKAQLATINAKIAAASGQGTKTGSLVKERKAVEKTLRSEIKTKTEPLTLRLRVLGEDLRQAKSSIDQKRLYESINERTAELKKAANRDMSDEEAQRLGFRYGAAGHSGTKWWVTANQEQASKDRLTDLSIDSDPKFLGFQAAYLTSEIREGTLCAGINQTKKSNARPLRGYDNPEKGLLYIPNPPPSEAYSKQVPRSQRKRLQRFDCWFRIGSIATLNPQTGKPGREKPEWIKLPDVIAHQEIPKDAIIIEALLKLERIGYKKKWWLILTLQTEQDTRIVPQSRDAAVVEFSAGVYDGTLLYGKLHTTSGAQPLLISTAPRAKIRKADGRSYGVRRDPTGTLRRYVDGIWQTKDTNGIVEMPLKVEDLQGTQRDWLSTSAFLTKVVPFISTATLLPSCLQDMKKELLKPEDKRWRSFSRLQRLYREWRINRVAGDDEAFLAMEQWARQDLHLYQWARSMQTRFRNRTLDTFRKEAARICSTYTTVYVDDRDLTDRAMGVTDDQASARTKWQRYASFGLFREVLLKTGARCGTSIEKVTLTDADPSMFLDQVIAAE